MRLPQLLATNCGRKVSGACRYWPGYCRIPASVAGVRLRHPVKTDDQHSPSQISGYRLRPVVIAVAALLPVVGDFQLDAIRVLENLPSGQEVHR